MSDRDFRLPQSIRPRRYAIHISANLDTWTFRGSETIEIEIAAAADAIVLHSVDLDIDTARLISTAQNQAATVTYDQVEETAVFQFPDRVAAGNANLELGFSGEILPRLRGFYRSQKDGARYAATQFEAADARRAFPCFDEPEFKARFQLTLEVPAELTAIANGAIVEERRLAGDRKQVSFAETPPISTYLVAYTVGPYEPTPVESTRSGVPVRVFLPTGMADKGLFARDAHVRSLDYLETYTQIPFPYGKTDAIGVPDFEAGAMENPGAITYRLTAIAADPESASTPAMKGIFYTAAHELTHMWWGDLVTMAWWDDLWLNESFATFIGYKVVADLVPEWGMWRDFVAALTRPFNLDALESTHPISFEVKNAKQATERFDVITYWKGAGVVRMLEGYLGAEIFRRGVHAYLNRYRESNATADDFWRELSTVSGSDVAAIANAWIVQPGHPLVEITATRKESKLHLKLTQRRFFADSRVESNAAESWPIPIVLKYGSGAESHEQRLLVGADGAETELTAAGWFFPNGGDASGFYRFVLPDTELAALVEEGLVALSAAERLALVGNQWALAKAGVIPLAHFFTTLAGFRNESDRAVLSAITDRLLWIDMHVVDDAMRPAFERRMNEFFTPYFERIGWNRHEEESADDGLRRATILAAMGELAASTEVKEEARNRLERFLREPSSLDPNLASVVVSLAAQNGDAQLFDRYLERKRAAGDDPETEQRFLFGLTAFEPPELVERCLQLCQSDEVRPQDRAHLLARLLGSRSARSAAWEFVQRCWDDLTAGMDPMLQQNVVRGLAQLTYAPVAGQAQSFLASHVTDETRETVAQVSEQLGIDATACQRLAPEMRNVLEGPEPDVE